MLVESAEVVWPYSTPSEEWEPAPVVLGRVVEEVHEVADAARRFAQRAKAESPTDELGL